MTDRIIKPGEQSMMILSLEDFATMVSMRLLDITNDISNLNRCVDELKNEIDELKRQKGEGVKE